MHRLLMFSAVLTTHHKRPRRHEHLFHFDPAAIDDADIARLRLPRRSIRWYRCHLGCGCGLGQRRRLGRCRSPCHINVSQRSCRFRLCCSPVPPAKRHPRPRRQRDQSHDAGDPAP